MCYEKHVSCFTAIEMLFLSSSLFTIGSIAFAQQKITGIVLSDDNLPLPEATVTLKSSGIATITLSDGSFAINATTGDVLEISFIGFKTQQIKIGNETGLKITLQPIVTNLDDVVVTGYTTQKVKEITGSVAVVKPKDLIAVPAGQVEQMLQGRVAGLNIITSGMPGAGSNVFCMALETSAMLPHYIL